MTAASRIVMLGTGTPNADPARSGPSIAIVVDDLAYLIDFGPGVVRRAAAAAEMHAIDALNPPNLTRAFLTHLHSDHTAGYPDLILTPWVLGRAEPLGVIGPPGLAQMTEHILAAYAADIRERLDGLEPANDQGYRVAVTEITRENQPHPPTPLSANTARSSGEGEPGSERTALMERGNQDEPTAIVCYRDERVTVEAFAVSHGSWPAFGFTFITPDRKIVISGDTTPVPAIIEQARGCDVLIHEVYSAERFKRRPPDWQRYHAAMHTSTEQLAAIAAQTRPGLLILTHQLYWGARDADLLVEIRAGYDGAVVSGRDLEVY